MSIENENSSNENSSNENSSNGSTGAANDNDPEIIVKAFAPNTWDPFDLVIIGFDTDDGPEHPLHVPNVNDPLAEEDILNVQAMGIIVPILWRKNGDRREVVAGRHRVRWLREANKRAAKEGGEIRRIKGFQSHGDENKMGRIAATENAIRHDPGCVTFAKQAVLMQERGDSEHSIAITLGYGKDVARVRKLISLLTLEKSVLAALENGEIAESTAYRLTAIPNDQQVAGMKELLASEGKVTGDGVKRVVAAAKASKNTGKKKAVAHAAPKRVVLKRVCELAKDGTLDLSEMDTLDVLMWSIGQKEASTIKGLTASLKLAEKPVKKKAEK